MIRLFLLYPILLLATVLVRNDPFFWDTVQLASKHGHFFYENNFQSLILPKEIDSGHPPLFGMYIALSWKVFGKTLAVSHFAMLPFLFGIVYFLSEIGKLLLGEKRAPWLVLLCFADPVLLGQSVLVSPDLMLCCFFLMAIWAIWAKKTWMLAIAVAFLGLTSTRGMMLGFALFGFSVLTAVEKIDHKLFFKKFWAFLPAGLLAGGFLFYHWLKTGWIGYYEGSSWAPSFEQVGVQGFLKNLLVLAWRLLDFGRIFIWVAFGLTIGVLLKEKRWKTPKIDRHQLGWQLGILAILVFLSIVPTQLFYKGLLAHRYFLPFFLVLNFLALYLFFLKSNARKTGFSKKLALALMCMGLATGNFWIYPQKVAMGWDSTLAHLPWHGLVNDAKVFLKSEKIPMVEVGTAFPNIGNRAVYELNGEQEGFIEKDLATNCYILYSNVMNDFTDVEIDQLHENWKVLYQREVGGVCMILFKNPNQDLCEN